MHDEQALQRFFDRFIGGLVATSPRFVAIMGENLDAILTKASTIGEFRTELNDHLRDMAYALDMDTTAIRLKINDHDNFEFWYKSITTEVAPFLEKHY